MIVSQGREQSGGGAQRETAAGEMCIRDRFIADARTIEYSAAFLRIMVVAMPMMSVCYPMIVQFQAMGRVKESLVCSILRKGVLDIPLLFLFNALVPLYGCMTVQPVVDSVSLVVALGFYRKLRRSSAA